MNQEILKLPSVNVKEEPPEEFVLCLLSPDDDDDDHETTEEEEPVAEVKDEPADGCPLELYHNRKIDPDQRKSDKARRSNQSVSVLKRICKNIHDQNRSTNAPFAAWISQENLCWIVTKTSSMGSCSSATSVPSKQ